MRSKMILLLALVMAMITTILFFNYTKQVKSQAVTQAEQTIQVVRAIQPIAANQLISRDVLEVVTVTNDNIHQDAITSLEQVDGHYTLGPIAQGEILLASKTMDQQDETFLLSRKIKEGYRAVSAEVTIVESVSNLAEPDDYVDVIWKKTEPKGNEPLAEYLVENVRVLAVGRKLERPVSKDSPYTEYYMVTFELKPNDALELVNATLTGRLHLTLRPSVQSPETDK